MKRAALESIGAFWGRIPPRLELSTLDYASEHTEISVREIRCAEVVRLPPHPFRRHTSFGELKAAPAFVFEIPDVYFWAQYGCAVVTTVNALVVDLSLEVWVLANPSIFLCWHLPESELLNGRILTFYTPE